MRRPAMSDEQILGAAINGITTVILPDHSAKLARARRELRALEESLRLWSSAEYLDRVIAALEDLKRRDEQTTEPPSPPPPEYDAPAED
jgi:hypothetical protein